MLTGLKVHCVSKRMNRRTNERMKKKYMWTSAIVHTLQSTDRPTDSKPNIIRGLLNVLLLLLFVCLFFALLQHLHVCKAIIWNAQEALLNRVSVFSVLVYYLATAKDFTTTKNSLRKYWMERKIFFVEFQTMTMRHAKREGRESEWANKHV